MVGAAMAVGQMPGVSRARHAYERDRARQQRGRRRRGPPGRAQQTHFGELAARLARAQAVAVHRARRVAAAPEVRLPPRRRVVVRAQERDGGPRGKQRGEDARGQRREHGGAEHAVPDAHQRPVLGHERAQHRREQRGDPRARRLHARGKVRRRRAELAGERPSGPRRRRPRRTGARPTRRRARTRARCRAPGQCTPPPPQTARPRTAGCATRSSRRATRRRGAPPCPGRRSGCRARAPASRGPRTARSRRGTRGGTGSRARARRGGRARARRSRCRARR